MRMATTKNDEAGLKKKRTTGRPSKFTPATRARILKCLTAGMPITLAATAAGTCYQSIVTWRAANPEFDSAIGEAVALGVEKRLAVIEKASDADDWRAAAWLLEHCQPEHFSKSRLEVTGADGGAITGAIITLAWPHQNQNPTYEITDTENRPALPAPDAD